MFRTTQAFIDRLESDGLKYKLLGKTHGGDEAVSLVFDGDEDAAELHLLCIFAQNGQQRRAAHPPRGAGCGGQAPRRAHRAAGLQRPLPLREVLLPR